MGQQLNIILIGFMGTGKSSVGRKLARKLNKEFIDTDQEIEQLIGLNITQIFKKYGEVRFRSEEKLMIEKIASKRNCVISTGGGTVLDPDNVAILKNNGILICLTASPATVLSRVGKNNNRPMLKNKSSLELISSLIDERKPYYKCADFSVDTSDLDIDEIVEKIFLFLDERGLLNAEVNG
ncbi:shikimate kinase [Bacillota bacterium LX-D]|nr:shikimate kinase [Bacillota bacterium LX-D]